MTAVHRPLLVDTSAFYAAYDESDGEHRRADRVFRAVAEDELAFDTLYTHRYVLGEFATLLLCRGGHMVAVDALDDVLSSGFTVPEVPPSTFERARDSFERYSDQEISFVDHVSAAVAGEHDVEHVFSFDGDFRTLDLQLVPDDLAAF